MPYNLAHYINSAFLWADTKYTLQGLLDELDVIESLEVPGKDPIFGEVLERQMKIYEAMGVSAPKTASLCVSGI